jgi:predicted RNase H-like HicB family nuclease
MLRSLTAVIEREGDGYLAICSEFDVAAEGDSAEEALANLAEALALFFEMADPAEIGRPLEVEISVFK